MLKTFVKTSVIIACIALTNSAKVMAAGDLIIKNDLSFDVNFSFYGISSDGPTRVVASGETVTVAARDFSTMIKFWKPNGPFSAMPMSSITDGEKSVKKDGDGNYGITLSIKDVYYPEVTMAQETIPATTITNQAVMIDSNTTYPALVNSSESFLMVLTFS